MTGPEQERRIERIMFDARHDGQRYLDGDDRVRSAVRLALADQADEWAERLHRAMEQQYAAGREDERRRAQAMKKRLA